MLVAERRANTLVRIERPLRRAVVLASFSDSNCWELFRFRRHDLERLLQLFQFPPQIKLPNGSATTDEEALLVLLRRLSYPGRLCELELELGVDRTTLSRIVNYANDFLFEKFHHLWEDGLGQWAQELPQFCAAISAITGEDNRVFGFLDGTFRPTARPSGNNAVQRAVYSGYKRGCGLKFQAVVLPNGIIADLFGPVTGRHHDGYMVERSRLRERLAEMQQGIDPPCRLYADAAYAPFEFLCRAHRMPRIEQERDENRVMSTARVTIEWAFGQVVDVFAFCDFKKNFKLQLQPVGKLYPVAVFLTNVRTCLYGSNISKYFDVLPPSLERYLHVR